MDGRLLREINILKEHFTEMESRFTKVKNFTTTEIDEVKNGTRLLGDDILYVAEKIGISQETLYPGSSLPFSLSALLPQNNTYNDLTSPFQSNLGNAGQIVYYVRNLFM